MDYDDDDSFLDLVDDDDPDFFLKKQKESARRRKWNLKTRYGITPEEYTAQAVAQGNVCAICGVDKPGGNGQWHIDHCHASGVNRGLLCFQCNTLIGKAKDLPDILRAAADYLERGGVWRAGTEQATQPAAAPGP